MDVKEAIEKRISVRKFQDKEISDDVIDILIEAARLAPSGHNKQPWRFKIVKDKRSIKKLKENNVFSQGFVYSAPLLIFCCADPSVYPTGTELDDPKEVKAIRDLSLASQNIALQCVELGLGSCYIGWVDAEKSKEVLDIPKNYALPYVLAIGYPDQDMTPREKKSKEEILI